MDDLDLISPEEVKEFIYIPVKSDSHEPPIKLHSSELGDPKTIMNKLEGFTTVMDMAAEYAEQRTTENEESRIKLLVMRGSWYSRQAGKSDDTTTRQSLFSVATQAFNCASGINNNHPLIWVGKGVMLLAQDDHHRAEQMFSILDSISDVSPDVSLVALLGKSHVAFRRQDYSSALQLYSQTVTRFPSVSAEVRFLIGLCWLNLGNRPHAELAFKRALDLDPKHEESMSHLAVLCLDRGEVSQGLQLLKGAYRLNSNNPLTLIYLCDHFYYKGDYNKVQNLASRAFHNSTLDKLKAHAVFQMGRVLHMKKEYDNAFNHYLQAIRLWPEHIPAQFGLAQMYAYRDEINRAIDCLEVVHLHEPTNLDVASFLGLLYTRKDQREKALPLLKMVLDQHPDDIDTLILTARMEERVNGKAALDAYVMVVRILSARQEPIPPFVWNNVGVLRNSDPEGYHDAIKAYTQAIVAGAAVEGQDASALPTGPVDPKAIPILDSTITPVYNLARVLETLCEYDSAIAIYKRIIADRRTYVDAYHRLGCIARDRGQHLEASEWFKEAIGVDEDNPEAWCLLGGLNLMKNEWGPAQKRFERVLSTSKSDPYCLLSLGNIYLANATGPNVRKYLQRSRDFYVKVLKHHPRNVYAAHGIGCVLSEMGNIIEAKDVFAQVREAAPHIAEPYINLGLANLAQGQPIAAATLFASCSKRFYDDRNPGLLNLLGRAYYDAKDWVECKAVLQRAIRLDPTDYSYRFNFALAQQDHAQLKLRNTRTSMSELSSSIAELQAAGNLFEFLSNLPPASARRFDAKAASRRASYCRGNVDMYKERLPEVEAQEKDSAERRQQWRAEVEAEQEARRKRQEEEAERAKQLKLEMENVAREKHYQTQQILEKGIAAVASAKKPARKRSVNEMDDDTFGSDSNDDEWGGDAEKRARQSDSDA